MSAAVTAARAWIGTPYVHRASLCGAGCDCLGLVRGVWREVVGAEPVAIPAYAPDWAETGGAERLLAAMAAHMTHRPLTEARPGDVIVMRMRDAGPAKHLGIQTETGPGARFVHAYSGRGVVESALSRPWARRIVARFGFPERD